MARKLTYECRLILKSGEIVPIDELPQDAKKAMAERLHRAMSDYYTQHPEEYEALFKDGAP